MCILNLKKKDGRSLFIPASLSGAPDFLFELSNQYSDCLTETDTKKVKTTTDLDKDGAMVWT